MQCSGCVCWSKIEVILDICQVFVGIRRSCTLEHCWKRVLFCWFGVLGAAAFLAKQISILFHIYKTKF